MKKMEIDLSEELTAHLEYVAGKTLIPASKLAAALVAAGLLGWSHPSVIGIWQPAVASGRWPVMPANPTAQD
jgi:hypothetical protein